MSIRALQILAEQNGRAYHDLGSTDLPIRIVTTREYRRAWWLLWLGHRFVGRRSAYLTRKITDLNLFHPNTVQMLTPGFCCDMSSIPLWFRGLVSVWETVNAGLWHDADYRFQTACRKECDRRFLHNMIVVDSIAPCRAYAAYWGVRLFGGFAWRENAKRLARLKEFGLVASSIEVSDLSYPASAGVGSPVSAASGKRRDGSGRDTADETGGHTGDMSRDTAGRT